jgi:hypothetical protein
MKLAINTLEKTNKSNDKNTTESEVIKDFRNYKEYFEAFMDYKKNSEIQKSNKRNLSINRMDLDSEIHNLSHYLCPRGFNQA